MKRVENCLQFLFVQFRRLNILAKYHESKTYEAVGVWYSCGTHHSWKLSRSDNRIEREGERAEEKKIGCNTAIFIDHSSFHAVH